MELRQYLNLIRKWLGLIVACTVIAGATAFVVSRQQIPIYEATATVLINQATSATQGTNYQDILTSERIARTYAQLLQDWPVLERTVSKLGFTSDYETLAKAFQIEVTVSPVRDTQLVDLKVEASDPQLATEIANTLPAVFMEMNQEMQRKRFAETRADLQAELATVEEEIASTQQDIEALRQSQNAEDQAKLVRLESQLRRAEATADRLLSSLEELRLTEVESTDNIVLTTPAQVPENPVRPRVLLNTLLAAIVGAMLALGAAFLIEYLDDTIKTPDEVRELTGLATLGAVVAMEENTAQERLVPMHSPKSPATEAYRVLRTNLQFSSVDKPLRTLLVTSPGPGEGKSTTAANLAIVVAQAGKKVILVDADLRRPFVHRLFQVPNNVGLTSALLEPANGYKHALQETDVSGLRVLTTGHVPPNPAELLGSARMRELLGLLQQEADMVILDSPPVLAVADAAILSDAVDGTLLVVSAGETRIEMLLQALERLESVGSRPLGVVLNKLTERKSGYYYYYYYHYATRYESSDGDDERGSGTFGRRGRLGRLRRRRVAHQPGQQPALGESLSSSKS